MKITSTPGQGSPVGPGGFRTRRATLRVCLAACLALATALPALAADDEEVGFVLEVVGTWRLAGTSKKLAAGDRLPAGGTLVPAPRTPKSKITVCLYTGDAVPYVEKTQLPEREKVSLPGRLWRAISGSYHGGVVHAISRGEDLREAVVPLADGRIELSATMQNLPAGKYLLEFGPPDEKEKSDALVVLPVEWKPKSKLSIEAGKLGAGLYRVRLLNARTRQPTGAEALVLAAGPDSYAADRKLFGEAEKLTESWDEKIRQAAATGTLRGCLESLWKAQEE